MKTLADLDNLYKTTIIKLPSDARLWYCTRHLDKLQLLLANNVDILDNEQKEEIKEIIQVTQEEIKHINELSLLSKKLD
jgi:hypothetical protein